MISVAAFFNSAEGCFGSPERAVFYFGKKLPEGSESFPETRFFAERAGFADSWASFSYSE
jgi:hypothetical protein